ncbi:hypothetical protein M2103_002653 [Ereboglobus sp. PH5-5]|nr:hypothetical protein [Ereboglobus sp. PH5-10]MDF9834403.1 hypothetical protein [Ereboglobus sp. PH5-5]
MTPLRIFISSVQKELAPERAALGNSPRSPRLRVKPFSRNPKESP